MQVDPQRLPHWVRVDFAARCARRVQPLFAGAWPQATSDRVAAVERAITLAERSVNEQRACEELRDAASEARGAAGRALIPYHYDVPLEDDEPGPADSDASLVASFVAKVAEKAAEAAAAEPHGSWQPTLAAFRFALDAIRAAHRPELVEVLEADFAAAEGKAPRRAWWRFW
jgi:hypothetical protein